MIAFSSLSVNHNKATCVKRNANAVLWRPQDNNVMNLLNGVENKISKMHMIQTSKGNNVYFTYFISLVFFSYEQQIEMKNPHKETKNNSTRSKRYVNEMTFPHRSIDSLVHRADRWNVVVFV